MKKTEIRKLGVVAEPDWIDVTTVDSAFEIEIDARSGEKRHRRRGDREWIPGRPDSE